MVEEAHIKVLLIEDNDIQAEIVEKYLEIAIEGVEITRHDTLTAGLECLAEEEYDAILLDLSLPDCDGIDTVLKAAEKALTVPIVVLTAQGDEGLGNLCIQAGAQDFLTKQDLQPDGLARALDYAVTRRSESIVLDLDRVLSQLSCLTNSEAGGLSDQFATVLSASAM